MVESLILSFRRSFDLPFVARMRIGTGDDAGAESGEGELAAVGDAVDVD